MSSRIVVTVHAAGTPNVWIVDIDEPRTYRGVRTYRAALLSNGAWLVRNAWRRQYLPFDSPTAARVVAHVHAHVESKGL